MAKFQVFKSATFLKTEKRLAKRYPSVSGDVEHFLSVVESPENLGIPLGKNIFKARIANKDAKRGKSGGYRLLSYLRLEEGRLILLYLYSKTDLANVTEEELDRIVLDAVPEES